MKKKPKSTTRIGGVARKIVICCGMAPRPGRDDRPGEEAHARHGRDRSREAAHAMDEDREALRL